jgi:Family of unknown function (DUF6152)
MSSRSLLKFFTLALGVASSPLYAHHSYSGTYNMEAVVSLSGSVSELQWRNPHSLIGFDATGTDGDTSHWSIELGPPACLMKDGFERDFLKAGDTLTVEISPAIDGSSSGFARRITLADGRTIELAVHEWTSDCSWTVQ